MQRELTSTCNYKYQHLGDLLPKVLLCQRVFNYCFFIIHPMKSTIQDLFHCAPETKKTQTIQDLTVVLFPAERRNSCFCLEIIRTLLVC